MLRFFLFFGLAISSLLGLFLMGFVWLFVSTPRPTDIRDCITAQMFQVRLCSKDADYIKSKDISRFVKLAVVASEDGGFYSHNGLDWFELRESFERNWAEGRIARGGSTITQQLAKNVYLNGEKSVLRKIREAIIAVQIEKEISKDEILEKYLNVVEFGPNIFGVGKASQYYFSKKASDLDLAEGIWLAFVLPSPKKYSSSFRSQKLTPFARKQLAQILGRLKSFKKISEEEYLETQSKLTALFGTEATDAAPTAEDLNLDENEEGSSLEEPSPSVEAPPPETPVSESQDSE